jgi:hypothetical protein
MIFVPGGNYSLDCGIGYAVGTYGTKDKNITLCLGMSWFECPIHFGVPILTLSGQSRVNKSLSIVSENWFYISENSSFCGPIYLGIQGIRYIARKLTLNFGLILVIEGNDFNIVPLPHIGIALKFDKLPRQKNFK